MGSGVMWKDINWEARSLQVQRQVTKKKGGGLAFSQPKTKSGIRRVDLGVRTLAILKEHRQSQFEEMLVIGE